MARSFLNQGGFLTCLIDSSYKMQIQTDSSTSSATTDAGSTAATGTDQASSSRKGLRTYFSGWFNFSAGPPKFNFSAEGRKPPIGVTGLLDQLLKIHMAGKVRGGHNSDSVPKSGVNDPYWTPGPPKFNFSAEGRKPPIRDTGLLDLVGISDIVEASAADRKEKEEKRRGSSLVVLQRNVADARDKPSSSTAPTFAEILRKKPTEKPKPIEQPKPKPIAPEQLVLAVERPVVEDPALKMYFIFVLQLGRGFRHSRGLDLWKKMSREVRPHGLWPHNSILMQDKEFEKSLVPDIQSMYEIWPSMLASNEIDYESHVKFWKDEWNEHGKKSGMSQRAYMKLVVHLTKIFGPTIDKFLNRHTKTIGFLCERSGKQIERKFLDVTKFIGDLKTSEGIHVTVHGATKKFKFLIEDEVEFQELMEIRIYLDGENPYKTLLPSTLKHEDGRTRQSQFNLQLQMNIM